MASESRSLLASLMIGVVTGFIGLFLWSIFSITVLEWIWPRAEWLSGVLTAAHKEEGFLDEWAYWLPVLLKCILVYFLSTFAARKKFRKTSFLLLMIPVMLIAYQVWIWLPYSTNASSEHWLAMIAEILIGFLFSLAGLYGLNRMLSIGRQETKIS